jgi:S1-C subfamily serine protease
MARRSVARQTKPHRHPTHLVEVIDLRSKKTISALLAVAAIIGCGLTGVSVTGKQTGTQGPAMGGKPAPPNRTAPSKISLPPEARNLIRKATGAVGLIQVRNETDALGQAPRPKGSGVVIRSDGLIVTNYHVIFNKQTNELYDQIFFTPSEDGVAANTSALRYRLSVALINKDYDLALLRVISDAAGKAVTATLALQHVELGDSQAVRLLDDLIIIGFPEKGGLTVTVNQGLVEGKDLLGNWIKTDARVIHGNSGGAAVDLEGKLIGIPTKVVADSQPIDKNGDGFPDDYRYYGAVGFLRPAHLITAMIKQLSQAQMSQTQSPESRSDPPVAKSAPPMLATSNAVMVRGVVKSSSDAEPVPGARVGLFPSGTKSGKEGGLLTWGDTNPDGEFVFKSPIPPGRYTIIATAFGFMGYIRDIEISENTKTVVVEMRGTNQ